MVCPLPDFCLILPFTYSWSQFIKSKSTRAPGEGNLSRPRVSIPLPNSTAVDPQSIGKLCFVYPTEIYYMFLQWIQYDKMNTSHGFVCIDHHVFCIPYFNFIIFFIINHITQGNRELINLVVSACLLCIHHCVIHYVLCICVCPYATSWPKLQLKSWNYIRIGKGIASHCMDRITWNCLQTMVHTFAYRIQLTFVSSQVINRGRYSIFKQSMGIQH